MPLRQKIILALVLIICTFSQVLPVIRSGLRYSYGLGFWGPLGHDGIWHLALINQINHPVSIPAPNFSGELLKNYHPFYDILIAFLTRLTAIPASFWLFQLAPIITSLAFLGLSFYLGYRLTSQYLGGLILVFLNTFGNSFGWLVSLVRGQGLGGESLFWSMQSPSTQLNPPFALSLVFLSAVIALTLNSRLKRLSAFLIVIFLILLPITKAYGGLAAFLFFAFFALNQWFYRYRLPLYLLFFAAIVALLLFNLYNQNSASLIEFRPFQLVNSMIDSPDRFYLPRLSSFRQNHPGNLLPIIISIIIFLIGNFSWRLLGIFTPPGRPISLTILFLAAIPLLFIQQATPWNIIQFLYYALVLANIALCRFLVQRKTLALIVVSTSLLAVIPTYQNYLGNPAPAALPPGEIEALNFLRHLPPGFVLTYPYDPEIKKTFSTTPIPLYAYETTAYVSAFSRHQTYLEDTMNLHNSDYPWLSRLQSATTFFKQQSPFTDRGFLLNNNIDYLYLTRTQAAKIHLDANSLSLLKIFENSGAIIYQVKR